MRIVLLATLLLALGLPAAAVARPGDPDPTFALGGRTAFTVGVSSAHVAGIALRPDGHALVAGTAAVPEGGGATSVTQLDPAGPLDLTFGTSGTLFADRTTTTNIQPAGVALTPDGATIVATTVTNPATRHEEIHLVRVLPTGDTDPGFGVDGVADLDFFNGDVHGEDVADLDFFNGDVHGEDVAVDGLGRILVAASTQRDGTHYMSAFRLTPRGHLDPVFAGGRVDLDSRSFAGAILPRPGGGAFVAGGTLRRYGNIVAVEISNRGRRLDRFGGGRAHVRLADHTRPGTGARDMAFGPGGTLEIAATVRAVGVRDRIAVARLKPNGHLDTGFGFGGVFTAGTNARPLTVQHMVRDARGRLLLAGAAKRPSAGGETALVLRLTAAGRPDLRFGRAGAVLRRMGGAVGTRFVDSRATALAVAHGRVWVAGVAFDDNVDPVADIGRAWPAVMRLLG